MYSWVWIEIILVKILCFFLIFSFSFPVFAEGDKDTYTATVEVVDQSESQRDTAFIEAAHQVAAALNSDAEGKESADLTRLFEHPEQYVASFSYITDPEQQDTLKIKVRFDRQALQQFFTPQHVLQSQRLKLSISGVTSEQSLNALSQYLSQIDSIKSMLIEEVNGENVRFGLEIQGKQVDFIQKLLADQRLLVLSAEDPSESSELRFKWVS